MPTLHRDPTPPDVVAAFFVFLACCLASCWQAVPELAARWSAWLGQ